MTATNAAVNLSAKKTEELPKPEAIEGGAKALEVEKQPSAQAQFLTNLLKTTAEKTLIAVPLTTEELAAREKGDTREHKFVPMHNKLSNEELVELAETEAEKFSELGVLGDQLMISSSDRYAVWGPVFPVRIAIKTGQPDTAELVRRIWDVIPEKHKTPSPTKAGEFLTCESAARERNQVAKGIISMKRWADRNKDVLFSHLGAEKADEDMVFMKKVNAAIDTVGTLIDGIVAANPKALRFIPVSANGVDAEGNFKVELDSEGNPLILDLRTILVQLSKDAVQPKLAAKKAEAEHKAVERKEHREAEEKEGEAE